MPGDQRAATFATGALALPLIGLVLLVTTPGLDVRWEDHPAHFWLVAITGGVNGVLAYATGTAARRRGDARLAVMSVGFLAAAGFLALHALATPGVVLDTRNAGFALATPVGLLLASVFAAAAGAELAGERAARVARSTGRLQLAVLALLAAWAALSLGSLPPLDDPDVPEAGSGILVAIGVAGLALYAVGTARFAALWRRRRQALVLVLAAALVLLAEAMLAVTFSTSWHATWWVWHLLMLLAFGLIAAGAQRQWHEERFGALYLDDTAAGRREVSVLFADLEGFTSWSEHQDPADVSEMLNAYFEVAVPPVVKRHGGEVDRIIGDALMVVFNRRGDQPDHALRAARAALELQEATGRLAAQHAGWPRFRAGVNTGTAVVGLLGTAGGRTHTVLGDAVNVASRLQGVAPPGGVAIGPETAAALGDAVLDPLGDVRVKGREQPVAAHRLVGLPDAQPSPGSTSPRS